MNEHACIEVAGAYMLGKGAPEDMAKSQACQEKAGRLASARINTQFARP